MVEITPVDGGFWRWFMAWALPTLNHNWGSWITSMENGRFTDDKHDD